MSQNSAYVLTGPKDDYDIPKDSLGKYIFESLKGRDPNNIVNVDANTREVLTCGRLLEESIKASAALKSFGLEKGDVIAIVSENTLTYCVPVVAALYLGVIVNPLNPVYSSGELKHGLLLSKPKLVLCSESSLDTVLKVTDELDFVKTVVLLGPSSNNYPQIISFSDTQKLMIINTENFIPEDFDYTEQGAFILLSSGTTGLPKGVLLTHENVRAPLGYTSLENYGNISSKDTTLQVLPYFHVFGLILQMTVITTSMKSVLMNKFKPEIFLKAIQEYKVTKLFVVPPLLAFLAKSPIVNSYDMSSITDIIVGAAPVGKELQTEAKKRLSNATIRQIYGLTETTGACTFQTREFHKDGSAGVLVPGITAKVWNADTKEILGPLKTGELCFKGPMIMKGYTGNIAATSDCVDQDGFYHTGDVGYYDEDNFFFIVERMKELIKYKGFQVPPAELESLILSHPDVKECGVIGIPDERSGQVPLAFVVRQKGSTIMEQEIVDFVAERISIQKRLYGGVRFISDIPKNVTGKILRRKLLELALQ